MCGEESKLVACQPQAPEIPPRVRGRERVEKACNSHTGNTPACAGKRRRRSRRRNRRRKYPRVCGEENPIALVIGAITEIPPRVRGRVVKIGKAQGLKGNTPACAGKRTKNQKRRITSWKYPRVCGEELAMNAFCVLLMEIPPRVRGRASPRP